jgi:hypothetical protein
MTLLEEAMATAQAVMEKTAVTYALTEWVTRPFSKALTNVVRGNFADPQFSTRGADDLLCYDRQAGVAEIFATVQHGALDNGKPVSDGPVLAGGPKTFDRRWNKIVVGPFGKSGAQLLFYDASSGTGEFFGVDANGSLFLINRNTGWRSSWTQIVAGNFSDSDGLDLLFYDASTGLGEFYSVDQHANIHFMRSNLGWRNSWYSILRGKFSDSKFDDIVFYDKGAGTGEFYHTDGNGNISRFSQHTNWRNTWRALRAGGFAFGSKYDALLFYEDQTGHTEFYATDGHGSISQLTVDLGTLWPVKAPRWQEVLAGNFIGTSPGLLSSLVGYDPGPTIVNKPLAPPNPKIPVTNPFQGTVSYFQLIPR